MRRDWYGIAEKAIVEAMERGEFDNLPGEGRPLDLGDDPYGDESLALAHHLLLANGFAPQWIEERRDVLAGLENARSALARSLAWCRRAEAEGDAAAGARQRALALAAFSEAVAGLNRQIASYNLKAPALQLHLNPIQAAREIARIEDAITAAEQTTPERPPEGNEA